MRKWILGCIVLVLAMGVWILYLDYHTKRSIQNLSKPPVPAQHLNSTSKRATTPPINMEPDDSAAEVLEDASDTPQIAPEGITSSTAAEPVFENEFAEQGPEPDDTGLSPELETLFSAYYPLHQKLVEVSKELNPLLDMHHLSSDRIREILLHELSISADGPERQALYAEIDEIHAWKEEVKQRTVELQDARTQLSNQRSTLLTKYGISSWQEFNDIHGDAYNTWKAKQ